MQTTEELYKRKEKGFDEVNIADQQNWESSGSQQMQQKALQIDLGPHNLPPIPESIHQYKASILAVKQSEPPPGVWEAKRPPITTASPIKPMGDTPM